MKQTISLLGLFLILVSPVIASQAQDASPAAKTDAKPEDAQKLLAQSEGLKVTNSILAARIDQLNLQSKYLMQDQKKVGPNLKDVRVKLRKEWIPVWLENPQAFRLGTKMPTFWRFGHLNEGTIGAPKADKDATEQIQAISAYLWQEGFDSKIPTQPQGNAQESCLAPANWRPRPRHPQSASPAG